MKFFWVVTIIGAVIGGFFIIGAFLEDSAPKQAASAAIAVALAVIPYCLARATSELSASQTEAAAELKGLNAKLETHTRLLATLANAANPAGPSSENMKSLTRVPPLADGTN